MRSTGSKWPRRPQRGYTLVAVPTDRVNEVLETITTTTGGGGRTGEADRRVYVGNLSYQTQWAALKDHMAQAGPVTHADILAHPDGIISWALLRAESKGDVVA